MEEIITNMLVSLSRIFPLSNGRDKVLETALKIVYLNGKQDGLKEAISKVEALKDKKS